MTKKIKFSRFGGISPVKQKGYDPTMPWSHSPPATKGIYCFIYPYYEPFLLGGDEYSGMEAKYSKFEYVKDKHGNKIEYTEDDILGLYDSKNWMKVYSIYKHKDGKKILYKTKKTKNIYTYWGVVASSRSLFKTL